MKKETSGRGGAGRRGSTGTPRGRSHHCTTASVGRGQCLGCGAGDGSAVPILQTNDVMAVSRVGQTRDSGALRAGGHGACLRPPSRSTVGVKGTLRADRRIWESGVEGCLVGDVEGHRAHHRGAPTGVGASLRPERPVGPGVVRVEAVLGVRADGTAPGSRRHATRGHAEGRARQAELEVGPQPAASDTQAPLRGQGAEQRQRGVPGQGFHGASGGGVQLHLHGRVPFLGASNDGQLWELESLVPVLGLLDAEDLELIDRLELIGW
mmetsp:Transcript_70059/g.116789  ORF Transcript_70059/g.116789 Transcript_70059/m.116789 type:complete len:266 (-) Transcript_70059:3291-4088(-)